MMKHLIFGSLSVLLMSAATQTALRAETTAAAPAASGNSPSYITQLTPFNLVYLAQRGQLKEQGIPSYGSLNQAYRSGKISARNLVEGAIKANRLSRDVLADQGYLAAVNNLLRCLPGCNTL